MLLQDREKQVQESDAELENRRILYETIDNELRETKANESKLQENLEQIEFDLAQSKTKNDELQESLEQMQNDLANSLQTAARLSSRLYSPSTPVKRERIKEEDVSTPVASPRRSEKRARY